METTTIPRSARLAKARSLCITGEARRIRMACGVSLSEIASDVAERSGHPISANAIWRWETEQRAPQGDAGAHYGEIIQALEGVLAS